MKTDVCEYLAIIQLSFDHNMWNPLKFPLLASSMVDQNAFLH